MRTNKFYRNEFRPYTSRIARNIGGGGSLAIFGNPPKFVSIYPFALSCELRLANSHRQDIDLFIENQSIPSYACEGTTLGDPLAPVINLFMPCNNATTLENPSCYRKHPADLVCRQRIHGRAIGHLTDVSFWLSK